MGPVEGRVLEDIITFHALYPDYGTVVTWNGQHTTNAAGTEITRTLWLHVTNVEDDQEQDWV